MILRPSIEQRLQEASYKNTDEGTPVIAVHNVRLILQEALEEQRIKDKEIREKKIEIFKNYLKTDERKSKEIRGEILTKMSSKWGIKCADIIPEDKWDEFIHDIDAILQEALEEKDNTEECQHCYGRGKFVFKFPSFSDKELKCYICKGTGRIKALGAEEKKEEKAEQFVDNGIDNKKTLIPKPKSARI